MRSTSKFYKISCGYCNAMSINGVATHEGRCYGHFRLKRLGRYYVQYKVWGLDVWGNKKDGFEVNDRWKLGEIIVSENAPDAEVIRALKAKGWLKRGCRHSSFRLDGDDKMINVESSKHCEPLFQLELQ